MVQSHLSRCYQYLQERFSFQQFIPLSAIFAMSAGMGTQVYLSGKIENVQSLILAFCALFLFLLRLRLFDEFKDFQHDSQYYRNRPVQRGLVKLKELGAGIFIVLFLEILIATTRGVTAFIIFCVAFVYSLLMFKEFFVSNWLRRRFTLYIASHEILIIPIYLYLFSLNGFRFAHIKQPYFWYLILFLGSQLFLLEVTRKIRPKELEISSGDTYSAQYGITGATVLITMLAVSATMFGFSLEWILFVKIPYLSCVPVVLLTTFLLSSYRFVKQSSENNSKQVFNYSILFVFGTNIVFILNVLFMS